MFANLTPIKFGPLVLDSKDLSESSANTIDVRQFPDIDGAELVHHGREPRRVSLTLTFPDPDTAVEDYGAFVAIADSGRTETFIHPILGAYPAKCTGYSTTIAGESREIEVSAEFLEDRLVTPTPAIGVLGGVAEVEAAVADVRTALASVPYTLPTEPLNQGTLPIGDDDVFGQSATAASGWQEKARLGQTAEIAAEAAILGAALSRSMRALEDIGDARNADSVFAIAVLRDSLLTTATTLGLDEREVSEVAESLPLLTFAATRYGAANAEEAAEVILANNSTVDPVRMRPGTYVLPKVNSLGG